MCDPWYLLDLVVHSGEDSLDLVSSVLPIAIAFVCSLIANVLFLALIAHLCGYVMLSI